MVKDNADGRHTIRSKAASELVSRQEGIDEFAKKYSDEAAAHVLALSTDLDPNQNPDLHDLSLIHI